MSSLRSLCLIGLIWCSLSIAARAQQPPSPPTTPSAEAPASPASEEKATTVPSVADAASSAAAPASGTPTPPESRMGRTVNTGVPPGSLWSEVHTRALVGMNGNARRVGDLITVIIEESTETELSADTSTNRKTGIAAKLGNLFGLADAANSANGGGGLGIDVTGESNFDGEGSTTRTGKLAGQLTCRVIEVLDNGNLIIWGWKEVRSNRETQYLVVTGTARPRDVRADNTINSSLLAEAKIEYNGAGVVGDKQGPGLGQRVIDHAWPF